MTRTRHCTSPAAAFGWPSSTLPRGRAQWACSGWAARTSFGRKSRGPELTAGDGNGNWSSAFLPCCLSELPMPPGGGLLTFPPRAATSVHTSHPSFNRQSTMSECSTASITTAGALPPSAPMEE